MTLGARLSGLSVFAVVAGGLTYAAYSQNQDMRKDATDATRAANEKLLNELPFSNRTDFENAHRGFIAALPTEIIRDQSGRVIWNPQLYSFIREGADAPDSVNPSLWRQSQLVNISGLFEVTDGVYQIRNLDLSNMTIIEGDEGITIVDPLMTT